MLYKGQLRGLLSLLLAGVLGELSSDEYVSRMQRGWVSTGWVSTWGSSTGEQHYKWMFQGESW